MQIVRPILMNFILLASLAATVFCQVNDEFALEDAVGLQAFALDSDQGDVGARIIDVHLTGQWVVFRIESGKIDQTGSVSSIIKDRHTEQIVTLDLETMKLESMEMKTETGQSTRDFDCLTVSERGSIEFRTIARAGTREDETVKLYRRNLKTGAISELKLPANADCDELPKIPGYSFQKLDDKTFTVSSNSDLKAFRITTNYPIETHDPWNLYDRDFFRRMSCMSPGNLETQLMIYDSPADSKHAGGIAAYDLRTGHREWELHRPEFENAFGKYGLIGIVPLQNIRSPVVRFPITVLFERGPSAFATIKDRKIEWTTQIEDFPDWNDACVSENGRYAALASNDVANERLILLDCKKQTVSTLFDLYENSNYNFRLKGVTTKGVVVLTDGDEIGLARFDEKWEFKRNEILKPVVRKPSEKEKLINELLKMK